MLEALGLTNRRVKDVDVTDGLWVTLDYDEVVHLRPSGNAPELWCYVESSAVGSADALLKDCMDRLSALCMPGSA